MPVWKFCHKNRVGLYIILHPGAALSAGTAVIQCLDYEGEIAFQSFDWCSFLVGKYVLSLFFSFNKHICINLCITSLVDLFFFLLLLFWLSSCNDNHSVQSSVLFFAVYYSNIACFSFSAQVLSNVIFLLNPNTSPYVSYISKILGSHLLCWWYSVICFFFSV